MNKLYKIALLLMIPGGFIIGQQTDNTLNSGNVVMQEAQFKTHQMQEQLGLTDDQTSKAFTINLDYFVQLDAVSRNNYSEEIKKEKIAELAETRDKLLNDVLTVNQSEQFKKSR